MNNDFIYFITTVIVAFVTAYFTVVIKAYLDRRRLDVVMCTITPLHYNIRTGGWTTTSLGGPMIHSYRLRVVMRNPGNIPRGIIDLTITWHLDKDSNDRGEVNPQYVVSPLVNIPANSLYEERFLITIPYYYVMTDEVKPFTVTYIDDTMQSHELTYTMNPSIRKKPTHIHSYLNLYGEGFVKNDTDAPDEPDDFDPY